MVENSGNTIIDFLSPLYYKVLIFHMEMGWSSIIDIQNSPGTILAEKTLQVFPYPSAIPTISPLIQQLS